MECLELPLRIIVIEKLIDSGLYDEDRAEELVSRIQDDENALLLVLGRLAAEEKRGGSKVQQCIRAIVKSDAIPQSLQTFDKLMAHELADPSFPLA